MITTSTVFDHRGRARGCGPIEVRVIIERKPYYIDTGVKVRKEEFRNGTIIDRPDAAALNERVEIITRKVEQYITDCMRSGRPVVMEALRRHVWASVASSEQDSFTDWVEEQIPRLSVAEGTRKHYDTLLLRLRQFGRMTSWEQLTAENVTAFDEWLHHLKKPLSDAQKRMGEAAEPISDAAVYNYHKCLKALLSRAMRFDMLDVSPYDRLRGQFKRGERENVEFLTEEEMAAIESIRPKRGSMMAIARDLFVFQMYTGLSYSDTQAFDFSKYREKDGAWVYVGERVKTGVPFVNRLLPPAVDVLERYSWSIPSIGNADYNNCLKALGAAAGIDTPLHSHLARHTFATFMLKNGVKIENLARMLGHTNITQTQRYAKVLAQSVHDDFEMIEEKMRKK